MIIGSHNSWSYLPGKKWWLKPFGFMAKCQSVDIKTQYEKYGVRCFDLRVRFNGSSGLTIAHGFFEYKINKEKLMQQLSWLNDQKNVCVRILHEVRNKEQYVISGKITFNQFCKTLENIYPNIKFWCGKNLYNWSNDYVFDYKPSCEENYSSVNSLKIIDDWWPWLYAFRKNKEIISKGTDKEILLIDYVNIGQK